MMVRMGLGDGFVAGASHTTPNVARAAIHCLQIDRSIRTVSGAFYMEVPGASYGESGAFIFADCGIVPNPSVNQLASIAKSSAKLFRDLTDKTPRVAMISYSTKGSATGESVDKVRQATEKARKLDPDLCIDGELQVDSALDPEVARLKLKDSPVAGKANVLVFPDLNSGNIGYKLVQRLAGATAVGPLIQGMTRPCSDLSRGCFVQDIVDAVMVTNVCAQHNHAE
jgi:phosphate acetyltransferase